MVVPSFLFKTATYYYNGWHFCPPVFYFFILFLFFCFYFYVIFFYFIFLLFSFIIFYHLYLLTYSLTHWFYFYLFFYLIINICQYINHLFYFHWNRNYKSFSYMTLRKKSSQFLWMQWREVVTLIGHDQCHNWFPKKEVEPTLYPNGALLFTL